MTNAVEVHTPDPVMAEIAYLVYRKGVVSRWPECSIKTTTLDAIDFKIVMIGRRK